jgi:hypothetical protein
MYIEEPKGQCVISTKELNDLHEEIQSLKQKLTEAREREEKLKEGLRTMHIESSHYPDCPHSMDTKTPFKCKCGYYDRAVMCDKLLTPRGEGGEG